MARPMERKGGNDGIGAMPGNKGSIVNCSVFINSVANVSMEWCDKKEIDHGKIREVR